jgi:hypothetical protein
MQASLDGLPLPIPDFGVNRGASVGSGNGHAAFARLKAIEAILPQTGGTVNDIGSHTGFFSIALADAGFHVIGYEPAPRLFRIAANAASSRRERFVAFMPVAVTPVNVDRLPPADVNLVLSVFHRWCEQFGHESAVGMLDIVWSKTRNVLLFESPNTVENESIRTFVPDMGATLDDAERHLRGLLAALPEGDVRLLDYLPTDFRPGGEHRHLFAVARS